MPGTLFVVATPIGHLEDITARALAVLRAVTVIAAEDTRRTAGLLARYGISTPTVSLHEHNERARTAVLLARLLKGDDIALVSDAGTPVVSDPGSRLVREAIAAAIRVEPVPGPSAVLAALVASGLPTETFCFMGFPPTRPGDRRAWLDEVAGAGRTVVFFEAPHRIRRTLADLLQTAGDRPIAIGRELTKVHEELVRGPISAVLESLKAPRGEFTVVVGDGHLAKSGPADPASDEAVLEEFGRTTEDGRLTRREAVSALARRHGRSTRDIYAAIERARKSVE